MNPCPCVCGSTLIAGPSTCASAEFPESVTTRAPAGGASSRWPAGKSTRIKRRLESGQRLDESRQIGLFGNFLAPRQHQPVVGGLLHQLIVQRRRLRGLKRSFGSVASAGKRFQPRQIVARRRGGGLIGGEFGHQRRERRRIKHAAISLQLGRELGGGGGFDFQCAISFCASSSSFTTTFPFVSREMRGSSGAAAFLAAGLASSLSPRASVRKAATLTTAKIKMSESKVRFTDGSPSWPGAVVRRLPA